MGASGGTREAAEGTGEVAASTEGPAVKWMGHRLIYILISLKKSIKAALTS